jgi:hypothetical protein
MQIDRHAHSHCHGLLVTRGPSRHHHPIVLGTVDLPDEVADQMRSVSA